MDVTRLIDSSYNEAAKALVMGTSQRSLARARERSFAKALIAQLQREFDDDHRVFAATQRGNAADFGTNQLLYDIAVCRIGAGKTAERKSEDFHFIAQALWQIEVDFFARVAAGAVRHQSAQLRRGRPQTADHIPSRAEPVAIPEHLARPKRGCRWRALSGFCPASGRLG